MYPFNDTAQLRPREKFNQQGVDVLSNAELLAIILNVGSRKEGVLDLASRIIKDYGFSALAVAYDYKRLAGQLQLSSLKAMQIVAVLELGRRIYLERLGKRPILNTPAKVFQRYKYLQDKEREELRVLYLNSRQVLILDELIAVGSLDFVSGQRRDILAPALEYNATGIILLHNHPSGEVNPSKPDIEFTDSVRQAATLLNINLLDHLIIGRNKYFSFQETGMLLSLDNVS